MRPNRKESSRTREKGMHPGPRWNSSVAFHNFAWKMASPYIYRRGEARIRDEQDLFSRPRNVIMKTCADVIDYPMLLLLVWTAMKLRNATWPGVILGWNVVNSSRRHSQFQQFLKFNIRAWDKGGMLWIVDFQRRENMSRASISRLPFYVFIC